MSSFAKPGKGKAHYSVAAKNDKNGDEDCIAKRERDTNLLIPSDYQVILEKEWSEFCKL